MSSGGSALDGSHGPHVLVDDVNRPVLADDDRHHLERVLRVRLGDALTVGDGEGRWRRCVLGVEPEPLDAVVVEPQPTPELTVAFALTKGDRPELVVQKLTELGIDRIVPFRAARSVVRWDDEKARRNQERLARVAREAVMQCRRAWMPIVEAVQTFENVASRPSAALADRRGSAVSLATPTVLIGPEGGWDEAELGVQLPVVRLADHVLRAETAAIAAATSLGAARALQR